MTKILKSVVAMLVMIMIIASCGGSDDPTQLETDRVRALLASGTWKIQNVKVDNVDKTSSFTGLQLTFTQTAYTSTNGNIVWPATGTWAFTSDEATAFTRGDGVIVNIDQVSGSNLVLSLNWDGTLGAGRTSSVDGKHTFTFSK